ncbi:hypothetical protein [Flavobacterium sp.]|uniref:hypothetical protein n=1 Tax=Flavobacterium sp. TaxID=239 RepID=UPI003D6B0A6F
MNDSYSLKEKEILNYLSKQVLSRKNNNTIYSVTEHFSLKFSKIKVDETWFEMNRDELVVFLEKRNNRDFSSLDKGLNDADINPEKNFYVNFY